MKIRKSSLLSIFLLQVIFLTSVNAFASTEVTPDLDSRLGEYLKEQQNTKAVILEKSTAESNFRSFQEHENDFTQAHLDFSFTELELQIFSEKKLASEFKLNGRNLLKIQIFPFHFFW